jgi:hypothetical protein
MKIGAGGDFAQLDVQPKFGRVSSQFTEETNN